MLDDSPNAVGSTTAGAVYGGGAWVKAPAGHQVTIRLREYRGSKVVNVRTTVATGTGAWQQVTVQSAPAAGATSMSIDLLFSLTTSQRAQIDDVGVCRL